MEPIIMTILPDDSDWSDDEEDNAKNTTDKICVLNNIKFKIVRICIFACYV